MDSVIVTGAGSGIGLAVARSMIDRGFLVYGLGGSYQDCPLRSSGFRPFPCNLGNAKQLRETAERILEQTDGLLYALVHNAKRSLRDPFDRASPEDIEGVIQVNLVAPLLLTRICLDALERARGFIITLAPTTPDAASGGLASVVAAGGLRWMNLALFEDLRERGIKVSTVFPQPNRLRAEPLLRSGSRPRTAIDPRVVGEAIGEMLMDRHGNIITELVIRPQRVTEEEDLPPLNLPFPKPSGDLETSPVSPANIVALVRASDEIRQAEEEEEERNEERRAARRRKRRRKSNRDSDSTPSGSTDNSTRDERHTDDGTGGRPSETTERAADASPEGAPKASESAEGAQVSQKPSKRRRRRKPGRAVAQPSSGVEAPRRSPASSAAGNVADGSATKSSDAKSKEPEARVAKQDSPVSAPPAEGKTDARGDSRSKATTKKVPRKRAAKRVSTARKRSTAAAKPRPSAQTGADETVSE